jgi:hypothetical protein
MFPLIKCENTSKFPLGYNCKNIKENNNKAMNIIVFYEKRRNMKY